MINQIFNIRITAKSLISISTLLFMLAITGCQHNPPEDWTEKKSSSSNECPDISGIYYDRTSSVFSDTTYERETPNNSQNNNVYSGSSPSNYPYLIKKKDLCDTEDDPDNVWVNPECSLNYWLKGSYKSSNQEQEPACPVKTIEIKQPDEFTIDVIVYEGDTLIDNYTLGVEVGDFSCRKGAVTLMAGNSSAILGYYMGLAVASGGVELYPVDDRSLALRMSAKMGGVFIVIPFYRDTEEFYRWAKVDAVGHPLNDLVQICKSKDTIPSIPSIWSVQSALSIPLSSLNAYETLASQYISYVILENERTKKALGGLAVNGNVEAAALLAINFWEYRYLRELALSNAPVAEAWLYKSYVDTSNLKDNRRQSYDLYPIYQLAVKGDANAAYQMWDVLNAYPILESEASEWLCLSARKGNQSALEAIRKWYPNINESDCTHIQQ